MNPTRFTAACVQMRSGRDPLRNRDAAVAFVREAAAQGADFVQTPEMTSLVERERAALFDKVGPEERDPTLLALREVARERGVLVHLGSIAVKDGDRSRRPTTRSTSMTSICPTARAGANRPPTRAAGGRCWPRRPGAGSG
jgi:predicted amidohydrolase